MRTITAPGVEWKEIDRSGYSPAMTGTACYVQGFSTKGEAYKPMEFTSRSAWLNYYGEPDNEAERYFYSAACEVLNQNGRLYCARLPYDNAAFEKMVGVKYTVTTGRMNNVSSDFIEVFELDNEIKDAAIIKGGRDPILYELSAIDEYRTDEAKVGPDTFVIVDTTGATYTKVVEDYRKGEQREVIGIVPVVTTAANALYAQQLLQLKDNDFSRLESYETLKGDTIKTLVHNELSNDGLTKIDFAMPLNTEGRWYKQLYNFKTTTCSCAYEEGIDLSNITSAVYYMTINENGQEDWKPCCVDENDTATTLAEFFERWSKCGGFYLSSTSANEGFINPETLQIMTTVDDNDVETKVVVGQIMGPIGDALNGGKGEWHGIDGDDTIPTTFALDANQYFSTIQPAADGEGLDPEHLKDIGVVVYKTFLDPSEGNKVSFEAVEAYCGSLFKDDVDPNTGVTKFIDTIINSQSNYINFFSNCFVSSASKKYYKEQCDILLVDPAAGASLGFYSSMTEETISVSKSIYDGMNKAFDKVSDINERDIDIVCDAGVSNIASYLKAIYGDKGKYDLSITDDLGNSMLGLWKCKKSTDASVKTWKTVVQKLDTFCKKTRKDCMFITEGLRPLVLQGEKKIIRDSKPTNTIDSNIVPFFPSICGLNTNYGAGYVDWFQVADDYTGDFFWVPPSIKAMGIYINTDVNFNYWDAPAGLNRGMVQAVDVAFSPTPKQAGIFYEKNWNFAINYPNDGIILEGQKTFQVKPSAFDRVNVRRLFLRLERAAYKMARYFVYEANTAYTRQRLVDALNPYFKEAKIGGGIYDYKIICDETVNTPEIIDRNELIVKIGIKPTRTIEFIMLDFIAGSTGASWEEIMQ